MSAGDTSWLTASSNVLETMPAAVCLLDEHDRLRYVNAAAERLLDSPRPQLLGTPLVAAAPELAGAIIEACRTAVATGTPVVAEITRRAGGERRLALHAWPAAGGPAFTLLDVTERHLAEGTARRRASRAALLAAVRAELSGAVDTDSALSRLARLVVPTLTDACIVTVLDREGRARDVGSWHVDPHLRPVIARYAQVRLDTLPAESPVARALAAGTTASEPADAVLELMAAGPARSLLQRLAPESVVVLPLPAGEHPVGVLTLYLGAGRRWDDDDLATARVVAEQAGRAVARVHRHSQQQLLTEALQRSLLTDPPDLDDTAIAVRFVPAAEAARVGGDWYDAFLAPDGCPVLVIGDVVGHDTAAAAAMGQLRGLLRGIAHQGGAEPVEILHGLDAAMAHWHPDTMATAVVARLEPPESGRSAHRLRWANAGHPPPMLLLPDGSVTLLGSEDGDLLLGVDAAAERSEAMHPVPPGSTVLLYTDGLVERRGSTLDEGLARLAEHLAALRDLAPGPLCDALLGLLLPGTPEDDVAMMAVRTSNGT